MATATKSKGSRAHRTPSKARNGEHQLFHEGRSTRSADIRGALPVKHNAIFMLIGESGDIPKDGNGYGIYFRDTCFVDELLLRVGGTQPITLLANADAGHSAVFEQSNMDFMMNNGQVLHKERLAITRHYAITDHVAMTLDLHNEGRIPIDCDLEMQISSRFLNIFTIRGSEPGKRGTLHPPEWSGDTLTLAYDGADQHLRTATFTFTFSSAPTATNGGTCSFHIDLAPGASQHLGVTIALADIAEDDATNGAKGDTGQAQHQQFRALLDADKMPQITTDNGQFNDALARGLDDLRMLITTQDSDTYIAAGIPWYVALFGRDSLISSFELMALQPEVARATLELLSRYQGREYNAFQDEAPGKILHELRVGERANLHEVPQIPYYGTVDATPWFLLVLGEYVRWTGDLTTFENLRSHVERALDWIDTTIKNGKSGFLEYGTTSEKGLANQGWKDSGNSIVNHNGELAQPPIALVEVQGYVYGAYRDCAWLMRQTGDEAGAQELDKKAEALRQRFAERYWMENAHFLALAIDQGDNLVASIASNAGQSLLMGIVEDGHAHAIAERLLAPDMFSGWGVRTLSERAVAFNPLDYQVGSVWPHDNALISYGLRRYGCDEEANGIFTGIYEAALRFPNKRLPEVFDGFARNDYPDPVRYPVACNPQAWAAGALPLMLRSALGWEPDAIQRLLTIRHPSLPPFLGQVEVRRLRVGEAEVDLRYTRSGERTTVQVLDQRGDLHVEIQEQ